MPRELVHCLYPYLFLLKIVRFLYCDMFQLIYCWKQFGKVHRNICLLSRVHSKKNTFIVKIEKAYIEVNPGTDPFISVPKILYSFLGLKFSLSAANDWQRYRPLVWVWKSCRKLLVTEDCGRDPGFSSINILLGWWWPCKHVGSVNKSICA